MRRLAVLLVAVALVVAGYGVGEFTNRDPAPVIDTSPARGRPLCMLGQRNLLDDPRGCLDPRVEQMTPAERKRLREAQARMEAEIAARQPGRASSPRLGPRQATRTG